MLYDSSAVIFVNVVTVIGKYNLSDTLELESEKKIKANILLVTKITMEKCLRNCRKHSKPKICTKIQYSSNGFCNWIETILRSYGISNE